MQVSIGVDMEVNFTLTTTEIVAWWGAVIATLVLLWDVYKWKTSGPQIKFSASSNMQIIGDPLKEGKKYITVKAVNVGDRSTTITNLGIIHYKNHFYRLLNKSDQQGIIKNPGLPHQLPYVLQPGAVWDGSILQDDEIQEIAECGLIYCVLYYSNKTRPKSARIKVTKKS